MAKRRKKLSEVAIKLRIIRLHLNEHEKFYRLWMMKAGLNSLYPKCTLVNRGDLPVSELVWSILARQTFSMFS